MGGYAKKDGWLSREGWVVTTRRMGSCAESDEWLSQEG